MSTTTPPNWPIYDVHLSVGDIVGIVERVYSEAHLTSIQELPKGKSFNNRIYSVHFQFDGKDQQHEEVVLKVIGRVFDSRKVQNEVALLLLLARFCPDVPAPKVLAWSDDGCQITVIRNGMYAVLSDPNFDHVPLSTRPRPWIMMSKCPGRVLSDDDLSGENSESIADQIAGIVKSWRERIPYRQEIGNIRLQPAGYSSPHALHGLDTIVTDPLLCETQPDHPIMTLQQYYDHCLADQIHKVETNKVFTYLCPLVVGKLQDFRIDKLPFLPCFTESALLSPKGVSVFTHQDLSPRNILISHSRSGPVITGVLDFEFGGFFPPEEEYLTCLGRQQDDWPKPFMDILLRKLDLKRVPIPISTKGRDVNNFGTLLQLIKLIEHTAPWWLQDGHVTGQDLRFKLDRAREVIDYSINKLVASLGES